MNKLGDSLTFMLVGAVCLGWWWAASTQPFFIQSWEILTEYLQTERWWLSALLLGGPFLVLGMGVVFTFRGVVGIACAVRASRRLL